MRSFLVGCVGAIFSAVLVVPANAQATRTWVSGVGDDVNPCSRTAPCKTFAGAIAKTTPAGEINVLDPGGFGAVTITKSITIRSDHIEAGVLVSGTNGIVVSAGASDRVVLEGLDIEGLGTGLDGIKVISGAAVHVIRCNIHNFTGNGINQLSNTANSRVLVQNSNITENNGGVNVQGNGVPASAVIWNTLIDNNTTFAVQVGTAGNNITLAGSLLGHSPTGIGNLGGTVNSEGPSNIISGSGTVTTTINFK